MKDNIKINHFDEVLGDIELDLSVEIYHGRGGSDDPSELEIIDAIILDGSGTNYPVSKLDEQEVADNYFNKSLN